MRKEEIIRKAKEICEINNISEYPVKIVDLCKNYGFSVFEEYLPDDVSGFIVVQEEDFNKYESGKVIVANLSELAARRRFTIAHELGHYILHKKKDEKLYAHRDTGESGRIESEANIFASNILMPEELVRNALELSENPLVASFDLFKIYYIAEQFAVSRSAAQVRLKQLGII